MVLAVEDSLPSLLVKNTEELKALEVMLGEGTASTSFNIKLGSFRGSSLISKVNSMMKNYIASEVYLLYPTQRRGGKLPFQMLKLCKCV